MPLSLRQRIERDAPRQAAEVRRAFGAEVRRLREDSGISQERLAAAAGMSQSYLSRIEAGRVKPTAEIEAAIALALGAQLEVRLRVGTGSPIRDHIQARIVEALLRLAHPRWRRLVEVPVHRPVRGSVDVVFHDPAAGIVIATEVQSQIRRLEQQLRWGNEKARALLPSGAIPQIGGAGLGAAATPDVSQLLVIRSTRANREIVSTYASTIRTAFPAPPDAAHAALATDKRAWPGAALLWATVEGSTVRILDGPPRGLRAPGGVALR
jgi:transcriptional regulator with XRE-family HTH domain